MSWLKTAVHKAVVVGQINNLSRIRSVADSVVQQAGQAVVGGARLLQDRIGGRNVQSFRQTAKRLEELSISCRGEERILLLRRWLVSLKEVERTRGSSDNKDKHNEQDPKNDESRQHTLGERKKGIVIRRLVRVMVVVSDAIGGHYWMTIDKAPDKTAGQEKLYKKATTKVLYHDIDHGGEPLNFHDVFLHSEALEGVTLSMVSTKL
ncbi:hypothetical protein Ancab_031940 [Ancistrocladus abbreviatus]